jgi:acyl-CoA reductase-like NAD-dependent aldehyde dehydrogenase
MPAVEANTHLVEVPALASAGAYYTRQKTCVDSVCGEHILDLSVAPGVFVSRAMSALRKAEVLPPDERIAAIGAAVDLFAEATIDDISPQTYQRIVSQVSGSPISVVRQAVSMIRAVGRSVTRGIAAAAPSGVTRDGTDPTLADGGALWVRRGRTLAVGAAGNSPAIHASWLPALALGFRIAVRPSRREPLTPYRLISALRQCGFGNDQVMLLATDHSGADEVLRGADLGLAFGGDDIVAKYATDPTISVQGPGRAKIVITNDVDWRDYLDVIVASISAGGGANCMNATAVLVEGNAGEVAEAIAERLETLPALPPLDEDAVLPVRAVGAATDMESYVLARAQGSRIWLGGDGIAADLGDGSAAMRPAVFELASAADPRVQLELPFPCVWLAPWSRQDGIQSLCRSLALTAMTEDPELIDALLTEPSIANVNIGGITTGWSEQHLPHDDYLETFLMRAKTVRVLPNRAA